MNTVKFAGFLTTRPLGSTPGPLAEHLADGCVLGRRGAPGLSFASGKYETYVMTLSSSTLGLVISSGVITCDGAKIKN